MVIVFFEEKTNSVKKLVLAIAFFGLYLSGQAQDESLHFIENKLTAYRDKTLQEKLFVHTDKPTYLTGEFVWFKVYYVEGYTHRPLALSRLAYVEIVNASNQPVLQAKVSLKPEEENGSLYLPLNLPTGNYKLRAYTAWMKNFGPASFFEKEIGVINPLSNAKVQNKNAGEKTHELSIFPEGGNLVKDIPSVLAFKGTDVYGRGLDFKGSILNEKNDTVASFAPFKFGMGNFLFQPQAGHEYSAVVLFADGQVVRKELPQVLDNGYTMRLQKTGPSQLQIEIRANGKTGEEPVYLISHTREVISVAEQVSLKNGVAVFTINPTALKPGITQFTVFDALRRPVAERLFFTRPTTGNSPVVITNKKEYTRREKINLTVEPAKETADEASLSLSVYRLDSVQTADKINIENYLLLTSDLTGFVESPEYYLGEPSAEKEQAINNLLLTQGWRRFRWQNVLNSDPKPFAIHPPEINGQIVNARIYDVQSGQPAPGIQTFLSLTGKRYQVYFAQSDSDGRLQYELKDYYGPGQMFAKAFSEADSLYRVEIQNPFSEEYTNKLLTPMALSRRSEEVLSNYSIGMQVRQVYSGDKLNRFEAPQFRDTFSFLGLSDYKYDLDDYTRFTTMEEVLREYVRPISVGVQRGQSHMVFIDEKSRVTHDNNLLVMLDGVPLYRPDRIFAYDPLKVKDLQVFPRPYVIGSNYFFGVASFSTYKGGFDAFDLDPHLIAMDFQGLQMQREFYAPSYETPEQKASRLPDYRNTLYWNPNIQSTAGKTASLSFYSCDQQGHYLGVLQGVSRAGQPIVREFSFEVK